MHTGERACGAYCPAMTAKNNKTPAGARVVSFRLKRKRIVRQTGGPGGDLLSHALRHSTIGAEGLNGRVRDGNGWDPLAITTRSARLTRFSQRHFILTEFGLHDGRDDRHS